MAQLRNHHFIKPLKYDVVFLQKHNLTFLGLIYNPSFLLLDDYVFDSYKWRIAEFILIYIVKGNPNNKSEERRKVVFHFFIFKRGESLIMRREDYPFGQPSD